MQEAVHLASKKLGSPSPRMVSGVEKERHNRLFITDALSNISFLIDTGADISIIPPPTDQMRAKQLETGNRLYAANGTPIAIYGRMTLSLKT